MKRAFSSYYITKNTKDIIPRKIQSNYNKNDKSFDNTLYVNIAKKELKYFDYKFFKEYKSPTHYKLKTKNIFIKKNNYFKETKKSISDATTDLLDTIKVQTGFNKFSNIAGNSKDNERVDRMVSAGISCDISGRISKRGGKKERIQSSINLKRKKRNFSSKFNFGKFGIIDSSLMKKIINSNIAKINQKNTSFNNNTENENKLAKTFIQKSKKDKSFRININIGTLINNQQNKEVDKNEDIMDKNLYNFLQERKDINNYENNNPEILKLRTDYLIKFAKINELYKKLNLFTDCFRVNFRELYNASIKSLIRYFDICNNFLLNEIKLDEKNFNSWMNLLNYIYNFCFHTSKIQKFFYDELFYLKNENLTLKQKLINLETELNTKSKEINEINKYIIKYDLNSKIKIGKLKDKYLNNIKNKFINQESQYVNTINNLKQEIGDLVLALNKNKPDLESIEKSKEQIKETEKKYEKEVDKLVELNGQKNTDLQVLSRREINLNEQINELEIEITNLKNSEQNEKQKNILLTAKIENLNRINEKNNKIIENLKNDIDNFKQKNQKENENTKTANIILMAPI